MRVLNGFKWLGVLLITISGITSADLILDNQRVITDITGITVSPSSGDLFITTAAQDYVVTHGETTPTTNNVIIHTFSPSANIIEVGDSIVISWTTAYASDCTASNGFGGWAGVLSSLNGSKSVTASAAGNFTFNISCSGTGGPATESFSVTVEEVATEPPPTTETCGSVPLSGNYIPWESLYHTSFPGPTYDTENLRIARRGYMAIRFYTGEVDDHGGVITVANTFTNGRRLGAISECRGKFDVADECTHIWGSRGGIGWATDGEPGYCSLRPNTYYYVNLTFTDGVDPDSTECGLNEDCIASVQHINLD